MEIKDEDTTVTLGIAIQVDLSEQTEVKSLQSDIYTDVASDSNQIHKSSFDFCNLPYSLDPNLGVMGQLLSSNIVYEISTFNTWNIEPHFLHDLPLSSNSSCESSILIFGGFNPSSALEKNPSDFDHDDFVLGSTIFQYLLTSRIWNYYGTMIEPRCYHACALVGQHVYVTGGYSLLHRKHGEMLAISSTDRLNLSDRQWKRCANMVMTRASHALVSYKGYLFAFGGRDFQGNILASVEIYYPDQDMWNEITSLPQPCMGLSAVCIVDTIWLVGGITYNNSADLSKCLLSSVYSFNPATKRWYNEEPLPYACAFSSCISNQDSLWIIGGCTSSDSEKVTMVSCSTVLQLVLSEKPSEWKSVASLLYPRHALTAVLHDECIFVLAGIESNNKKASDKIEVINTITNTNIECASMPAPVVGCTSVHILVETANYMHMKCETSYTQDYNKISNLLEREKYGSNLEADNYFSETSELQRDSSEKEEGMKRPTISHNSCLGTESSKETISENTKNVEDSVSYKNMKEITTKQENIDELEIFKSNLETHTDKTQNYQNVKYRASMEIFLNSGVNNDVTSNVIKANDSPVSKWLDYFHILSKSDEELHKNVFQLNYPKVNLKTEIEDIESQENCKSAEVKYFEETDLKSVYKNNSNIISSCVQDPILTPNQSFIYVESDIKSDMLVTDSSAKKFVNKYSQETPEHTSTLKETLLDAPFETKKIEIHEESFPIILLIGGECLQNIKKSFFLSILSYDCFKSIWENVGYMPEYRCHHCVIFLNNKIYVIGGYNSENSKLYENITKKVLCYDVCNETWRQIGEMNFARAYHSAFVFKNEIYVLGGRNELGDIIASVEVYDDSINQWKECKSLPHPVLGGATSIIKNVLYVFGGIVYEDENEVISYSTFIYDFTDKRWSAGPDMPSPLAFCGVHSSPNSAWLFGGLKEEDGNIISAKDIFKFDANTKIWSKEAELSIPRHASVTVSLGPTVYIIGGHSTQDKKEVSINEKIDTLKNEVTVEESVPIAISGRAEISLINEVIASG